jgi:pimeloyl-ACP methyl ester carboxylesterase
MHMHCELSHLMVTMQVHCYRTSRETPMAPQVSYAQNGDVSIAYETFGEIATGVPLLGIMGLDFQMVWWPDANRDTGLSTHFASARKQSPWLALAGRTRPAYTTLDMLDDALAVMDALGWTSAHVMGGSMGAALAQALAVYHPERVRSVISCMGLPADAHPLRLLGYLNFSVFAKFRKLQANGSRESQIELLVSIFRGLASPGYPFPERWAREAATISHDRSPRDPGSTQRQLAAGRAQKLRPIAQITVPTLVISGQDDPLIKVKGGRDTAARIPGARFVSYPGMGHSLPEELWPQIIDEIAAVTGADRQPAT